MPRAEGGEAADGKPEEEAKEWVDDGSLPLEDGDKLPFFLLDAHEELATPGTLYLFGKACLMIAPLLYSGLQHRNISVLAASDKCSVRDSDPHV